MDNLLLIFLIQIALWLGVFGALAFYVKKNGALKTEISELKKLLGGKTQEINQPGD
ncbi:MAG: hypothetical protein V3U74_01620 [Thermodesulfobacteriota bacterium]